MADKLTYNEARTAVERIRLAVSAFDQAEGILAKAEEADGVMRLYREQTPALQADWEKASALLADVQSRLSTRRSELEMLNAQAAKQSEEREARQQAAVKSEIARYKQMTDQLDKAFQEKRDRYTKDMDDLSLAKTKLQSEFDEIVAKLNIALRAGTRKAEEILKAVGDLEERRNA